MCHRNGTDSNTGVQANMTAKHFKISVSLASNSAGVPGVIWALVYAPNGSSAGSLSGAASGSLYEPSQFVIGCGVWDFDAGPLRTHIALGRILHPGD